MTTRLNKFHQIISLPFLYVKCNYYWRKTNKTNLPGNNFFQFGKSIGLQLLKKLILSPKLLLNPVSIVRYFEYDFALRNFLSSSLTRNQILDISSPYLFGFYLASSFGGEYYYINPDKTDLSLVKKYSSKLKFTMKYSADSADATKLSFPANSFSQIISISVI